MTAVTVTWHAGKAAGMVGGCDLSHCWLMAAWAAISTAALLSSMPLMWLSVAACWISLLSLCLSMGWNKQARTNGLHMQVIEEAGQGRAQQGRAGRGGAGRGGAGRGRAGQGRAGHGRAGQGRAGQGRAGQGRAGQSRAGQGSAGRGRAEQGRARWETGVWRSKGSWVK